MAHALLDPATAAAHRPRMDAATSGPPASLSARLLFLGRSALAQQLSHILCHASTDGQARWDLAAFTSQKAALQAIRTMPPQAVIVEVDGKPKSRVRFCEMVRYRLPAVVLVALGESHPQSALSWSGYLALPLEAGDVLALLERIGRPAGEQVLQRGPIRLDLATRTVYSTNGQHHMTPKQCALLHLLMTHPGEVVSRSEIMQAIWETSYMEDTRTLDVHIRWLREHIEPDPSNPIYLLTMRGQGYRLRLPEDSSEQ